MKSIFFRSICLSIIILVFITTHKVSGQEVGLSFSYFLPKNGSFSTPISPFSLRGVGFDFNDYMGIQTGFSLYRMSGLNVIDIDDFETKDPIVGPNFTLLIPLELVLQYAGKRQEFRIKGGGFGFLPFDNKLNKGNLDKAIRKFEGWDVATSDLDFDSKPGYGYFFGAEYIIYVTRRWGLSLEANYLIGGAGFALSGSYSGGITGQTIAPARIVNYEDSKIDLTGLEISIGILISQ